MKGVWQDIRYGFKLLVKNPGYTAAAIFSLTIGIGLNSTIFCLVDRLILQPLPVERPDELVLIRMHTEKGGSLTSLPYPQYLELRNQSKTLSGIIGSARHIAILNNGEVSELLLSETVTRNYFSALGVKPHLGRVFRDGDKDATAAVAVISYGLWLRRFGGDPAIVGKEIELTRRQITVIGIAPKGFGGTDRPRAATDVWHPVEMFGTSAAGPRGEEFDLLGRTAAGISVGQAQAEVDAVVRRLTPSTLKADRITGVSVVSEAEDYFHRFGRLGPFLMAVTGLILLIACANVSNMLLARSQARRKEIAIRLALGGSRLRLTRQLLTEGLVLSLASAAVGWLLTRWGLQALPALLPPMPVRMLPDITLNARVLGFTIGLALLSTLIFALIPAFQASKLDLVPMLNESAGTEHGGRRYLGRSGLVVGQLCISLVLLTQSALMVKSFVRGLQSDVGFEKKNMLLAQFALGLYEYNENQAHAFYSTLQERTQALPGVKRVSFARRVPLSGSGGGLSQQVTLPGEQTPRDIRFNTVGPNYFETIGTRILKGRAFTPQDIAASAKVALVNQEFARRFWPDKEPLGQVIRIGQPPKTDAFTIVGMVQDGPIVHIGEDPAPYLYQPFVHGFGNEFTVMVETDRNPNALAAPFRQAVRATDKHVAPLLMGTLKGTIRQALYEQESMSSFMGAFGLLGLILASFGLYGIVSYTVSQRTREIGLRMALGAQRGDALRMVLRQGLTLALTGAALGLPLAMLVSHSLSSVLYQVSPADPVAVGGTVLLLVGVALFASYIPARRATKVDPIVALHHQ
jgi:putative ABC transport system permease protein